MKVLIVEPIKETRNLLESYFAHKKTQYSAKDNIREGLYLAQDPGIAGIFIGDCFKEPDMCLLQERVY